MSDVFQTQVQSELIKALSFLQHFNCFINIKYPCITEILGKNLSPALKINHSQRNCNIEPTCN